MLKAAGGQPTAFVKVVKVGQAKEAATHAATEAGELACGTRREFKTACKTAEIGTSWTPRELRHSFVTLMSNSGVPVEEIARLAGHSSSRTTQVVYRRELRPVLTTGAEAMDRLFKVDTAKRATQVDNDRASITQRIPLR